MRPIDADALVAVLEAVANDYAVEGSVLKEKATRCAIKCLTTEEISPTLDYAPVRHGEWGASEIIGYDGIHAVYAVPCSACGEYAELYRAKYCPKCGAKMDGGKKNG